MVGTAMINHNQREGIMRAIVFAAIAIGCGAAAPIKPLHFPYLLLQREYYGQSAKPYGFTICGVSYAHLNGVDDHAKTLAVLDSQFQNPLTGSTQTAGGQQMFLAGGDWTSAVTDAIKASKRFQNGALSGSCPVATARTLLVAYPHASKVDVTVLAVRCESATGVVTGATTAASTYLSQLMRGAVPTCAAIDGADFSTMPMPEPNVGN